MMRSRTSLCVRIGPDAKPSVMWVGVESSFCLKSIGINLTSSVLMGASDHAVAGYFFNLVVCAHCNSGGICNDNLERAVSNGLEFAIFLNLVGIFLTYGGEIAEGECDFFWGAHAFEHPICSVTVPLSHLGVRPESGARAIISNVGGIPLEIALSGGLNFS